MVDAENDPKAFYGLNRRGGDGVSPVGRVAIGT